MASIKYGNQQVWSDTTKITNPSLILNDNGTLRYTPLLNGSNNGTVIYGDYEYTLGGLKVGDKRVAIGRKLAIVTCTAIFRLRWSYEQKTVQTGTDAYNRPIYGTRWYSREYIDNVSTKVPTNFSRDIQFVGFSVNGTTKSAGLIWEAYNYGSQYPYAVFNVQAIFENAKGQRYYSNTISKATYGSGYTEQEKTFTVTARVHL